ncbi:MAG: hypothetical protein MR210_08125 [Erysipelotrichaceae bacterium]|nr:hypothetical protein [Erysipelotrichaceae bacterium]MDY5251914.1 hypothetical protein [Erysipelotrichaceae bacterium]
MFAYLIFFLQITSIIIFIFARQHILLQKVCMGIWGSLLIWMIFQNDVTEILRCVLFLSGHLTDIYYERKCK